MIGRNGYRRPNSPKARSSRRVFSTALNQSIHSRHFSIIRSSPHHSKSARPTDIFHQSQSTSNTLKRWTRATLRFLDLKVGKFGHFWFDKGEWDWSLCSLVFMLSDSFGVGLMWLSLPATLCVCFGEGGYIGFCTQHCTVDSDFE